MTYAGAWGTIIRSENGWIVHGPGLSVDPNTGERVPTHYVFSDKTSIVEGSEMESLQIALANLLEFLEVADYYQPKRIEINVVPNEHAEAVADAEHEDAVDGSPGDGGRGDQGSD